MPNKPQDQFSMQNPLTQYPHPPFPAQGQAAPGLDVNMQPKPDHGEASYKGFGRLAGRKALITGADSGIGRAVAIAFAREGADIALNYMPIEQPDAREVIKLIEAEGRKVVAIAGDLKDEQFCKELVEQAHEQLGGLDILVNVAGKQEARKDISQITHEQFDHTLKTNVYALFWLCQAGDRTRHPGQRRGPGADLDGTAAQWRPATGENPRIRRPDTDEAPGPARRVRAGLRAAGQPGVQLHHRRGVRRDRRQSAAIGLAG